MTKIQDLIDQIMNAERLGLSVAEVADAKQELALALAKVAFDVNQALSFDPVYQTSSLNRLIKQLTNQ